MSTYNIGLVAEGPRDIDFIESLLYHLFPDWDLVFYYLQPEGGGDTSENWCGWPGVRRWCEELVQEFSSLEEYRNAISPKLDLIIVQVDADIVYENKITEISYPKTINPPQRQFEKNVIHQYDQTAVSDKISLIHNFLLYWFDGKVSLDEYIQCIPSDNFEAWILFAFTGSRYHMPPNQHIEQLEKPGRVIAHSSTFCGIKIPRKNGTVGKSAALYHNYFIPEVINKWPDIAANCPQAGRFDHDVKRYFSR